MNIHSIAPAGGLPSTEALRSAGAGGDGGAFGRLIGQVLDQASAQQLQADQAVRDLATGQTDNLHNVMLAVAKADLTFRMVLEIRNRLTEAMQEIMRMQV